MNRDDLPLLSFTLLVQLALGAVALAAMAPLRVPSADGLILRLLLVAGGALVVASAISMMHLGVKAGALRALRNVRTSWLSREVLFTGLFTALTLGAAVAQWLGVGGAGNLLWFVTLNGFAAVFTMSRLYQETVRPAWATAYTPLSFFLAAVLLGVALGAPLVQLDPALPAAAADLLLHDIGLTAAGATAGSLLLAALYPGDGRLLTAIRLLMTTGGTVALAFGGLPLLLAGSALLAAGEVLGRMRFFGPGAAATPPLPDRFSI